MGNQPHVFVKELVYEKQRWQVLHALLKKICDQNQITFIHRSTDFIRFNSNDKILCTVLFDLFGYDFFVETSKLCEKLGKKIYFLVDSWVDQEKFRAPNAMVFSKPELFGLTALPDTSPEPRQPSRLFNCFIHRTEPVRQSWFYFLFLRNLLDQGYVSYKLYQLSEGLSGLDLFDSVHQSHLSNVEHFRSAYTHLRPQVPYSNFVDRPELDELILDSKYSLVLDTYAPDDDVGSYYISEKVTRALQFPTHNLFFLQKGTMHKMRDYGLEINPSLLNIDLLDWRDRQQKILEILQQDLWDHDPKLLHGQTIHNRAVLNDWLDRCMHAQFYDDIFDIILAD